MGPSGGSTSRARARGVFRYDFHVARMAQLIENHQRRRRFAQRPTCCRNARLLRTRRCRMPPAPRRD